MRVWVYGDSPEQIRAMADQIVRRGGVVVGCSIRKTGRCAFPHSGLTPAVSAAALKEFDVLIVPTQEMLGSHADAERISGTLRGYGVSIRSASSCGISSS